ncbi:hypothetical protein MHYP_G00354860 [Metynnis hypsauchen]
MDPRRAFPSLSPGFATLGVFQPSAGVPPQHSSPAIIAHRRPTVSPGQGLKLQHKREGTHLFQQHNAKDGILVRDHLRSIFHGKRAAANTIRTAGEEEVGQGQRARNPKREHLAISLNLKVFNTQRTVGRKSHEKGRRTTWPS